ARRLRGILRERPRRRAQLVTRIGVRLVAQLDARKRRAEDRARRLRLPCGGGGFEVREADRQENLPAAARGERGETPQVFATDRTAGPRGTRGLGVRPGDLRVSRNTAEAQNARSDRAQQRDEVPV